MCIELNICLWHIRPFFLKEIYTLYQYAEIYLSLCFFLTLLCLPPPRTHTYTHAHTHTHTHSHTHTHTHSHIHSHTPTHTHTHTHTHAHTHTRMHARMHVRTHSHSYQCCGSTPIAYWATLIPYTLTENSIHDPVCSCFDRVKLTDRNSLGFTRLGINVVYWGRPYIQSQSGSEHRDHFQLCMTHVENYLSCQSDPSRHGPLLCCRCRVKRTVHGGL